VKTPLSQSGIILLVTMQAKAAPIRASLDCYIVDAFVNPSKLGSGNPAAVVVLDNAKDLVKATPEWMQTVAAEFNLAETAFLWLMDSNEQGNHHYQIRYFSPQVEVPLCGHATLASAAILFQTRISSSSEKQVISFHTGHDKVLRAELAETDAIAGSTQLPIVSISMEFPSCPPKRLERTHGDFPGIVQMMQAAFFPSLSINWLQEQIEYIGYCPELGDLLVELSPTAFVAIPTNSAGIKFEALMRDYYGYQWGITLCCQQSPQLQQLYEDSGAPLAGHVDFVSRCFVPKAGTVFHTVLYSHGPV
jgi:Phenazine biosynthesis-like protein